MFFLRATAPRSRCGPSPDRGRAAAASWWVACAAGALAPLVAGCGTPNPRILDATEEARGLPSTELGSAMPEQEKIRALLAAVRESEHVFVLEGIERSGPATADKLQLLLERDPTGVRSAREFIDRIAAPRRDEEGSDRVRIGADDSVPARHWYLVRLAEIEGRPPPAEPPEKVLEAEQHARRLRILDALSLVQRSSLKFVVPPRAAPLKPGKAASTGPKRKRKPKRKEYDGEQFADLLRKKWEFLGADIEDLDTFIDEIATDSFTSMARYRVVLEDGREEDFGVWLRGQMQRNDATLAQGGAP